MPLRNIADEVIETDVLVLGGGLSGKFAAIAASDGGAKVTLFEKSTLRRGGPWAGFDHTQAGIDPGEVLTKGHPDSTHDPSLGNECLVRPGLRERFAREVRDRVLDLERFGVPVRWPNGEYYFLHKTGQILFRGADLGIKLTEQVHMRKVNVLERTISTGLLTKNGAVVGATGVNVRNGKFIAVNAKATIIASGTASNGHSIAYDVGAELVNMEFGRASSSSDNKSTPFFSTSEPLVFSAGGFVINAGDPFVNAKGEQAYEKWAKKVAREAGPNVRHLAVLKEYELGNGPVYVDLTDQPEDVQKEGIIGLMNERPIVYKFNVQRGIDYKTTLFESNRPMTSVIRRGGFPLRGLGGVLMDEECKTSVKGLYVAGDVSGGGSGGDTGAFVHGHRAGKYAAEYVNTVKKPTIDEGQVKAEKERVLAPMERKNGVKGLEMVDMVMMIVGDYLANPKSEGVLLRGLERLEVVRERDVPLLWATNPHELMHTVSARNMIPSAELCMKASIMRKESRLILCHERIEYPEKDDKNWAKAIVVTKDLSTGETKLEPRILKAEKYDWRD